MKRTYPSVARPVAALAVLALASGYCPPPCAAQAAPPPPAPAAVSPELKWEKQIAAFEERDKKNPAPSDAVLFIGSSSIGRWKTLAKDFPEVVTINRGFGGSQIADSVRYVKRIVVPYKPRAVVFYAGDNDLAGGKSPDQVRDDFKAFVDGVRGGGLTETTVFFLAVKPSPSRVKLWDKARRANERVREWAQAQPGGKVVFVDVATPMLGADGQPRAELFVEDRLHMNGEGYRVWTRVLAPLLAPYAAARR